jgi:hypothetical protein
MQVLLAEAISGSVLFPILEDIVAKPFAALLPARLAASRW